MIAIKIIQSPALSGKTVQQCLDMNTIVYSVFFVIEIGQKQLDTIK